MRIITLILLMFFAFSVSSQSRKKSNNLFKELIFKIEYFTKDGSIDSSVYYYEQAVKLAENRNDTLVLIRLSRKLGKQYELRAEYVPAIKLYYQSIGLNKDLLDIKEKGLCLLGLSNINFRFGNQTVALQQGFDAASIFEQLNDSSNLLTAYILIGQVYIELNKLNEAIDIYNKALLKAKKTNDKKNIADILDHIGVIYTFQKKYQQAIPMHQEAMKINRQIGNKINLGINYANIGEVYMHLGKYRKALENLNKALVIERETKFYSVFIYIYYTMGATYSRMHKSNEALIYFNKSLDLIQKTGEIRERYFVYQLLSEHYERNKFFLKALEFYKKYSLLRDSLNNQANSYKIEELKTRYELAKKEQENKNLLLEKDIQKKRIKIQNLLLLFFIISLIMSVIFVVYIYISRKKLQSINKTKDLLFSIIGHDLRGPMGNIKQLLELVELTEYPQKDKYIKLLKLPVESSFNLLEDLLVWSGNINKSTYYEPQKFVLKELINQNNSLFHSLLKNKKIEFTSTIPDDIMVFADKNHVSAILRNLISNAIKFSPKNSFISIRYSIEGDMIKIMVVDTGLGLTAQNIKKILNPAIFFTTFGTKNEKGSGLGISLVQSFVKLNKGKFGIESEIGVGSTFFFTLPLAK
ncbi:MAG: tetratricopeptide repeat-containing sensor histidine kinase [Bacteroidales bacterium]|nr:tetratricopeptide repeat-containing sensor histidine kinase [Bacteroidales bacterium]